MTPTEWREFEHENRAMIAVAEACWRPIDPSHSWHVFDWMTYKLRCKHPLTWGPKGGFFNLTCS
jgi:hypothetical protein